MSDSEYIASLKRRPNPKLSPEPTNEEVDFAVEFHRKESKPFLKHTTLQETCDTLLQLEKRMENAKARLIPAKKSIQLPN